MRPLQLKNLTSSTKQVEAKRVVAASSSAQILVERSYMMPKGSRGL